MKQTDNTKETPQATETQERILTNEVIKEINQQKPLMRYFDLIEDTTEGFVLGYN